MNKELVLENQLEALEQKERVTRDDVIAFLANQLPEESVEYEVNISNLLGRIDTAVAYLESISADDTLEDYHGADALTIRFGRSGASPPTTVEILTQPPSKTYMASTNTCSPTGRCTITFMRFSYEYEDGPKISTERSPHRNRSSRK